MGMRKQVQVKREWRPGFPENSGNWFKEILESGKIYERAGNGKRYKAKSSKNSLQVHYSFFS